MVQAVITLGMGPVEPEFRGNGRDRKVVIANFRMRHNAIATKELAANGYIDLTGYIVPTGGMTAKAQLVEEAYREHLANGPKTEAEKRKVLQTSEAELMGSLIGSHVSQEILLENEAVNTIENFVRSLNLLDAKANGLFTGKIAVVGSNFGHLTRASEIAKALGFSKDEVTILSAEQILRHFGYDHGKLDEFLMENVKLSDIQMHERYLRGIQKIPEYVMPAIRLVENDTRLMQMIKALRTYYGANVFANLGLNQFEKMSPEVIRTILSNIKRKLPPKEWGTAANLDVWQERIREYDKDTKAWITRH